jgi:tetratricopeptide (TPR) repeat protein
MAALESAPRPRAGTQAAARRLMARVGAVAELDRELAADAEIAAAAKSDAAGLARMVRDRIERLLPAQRLPVEAPVSQGGASVARRLVAALEIDAASDAAAWTMAGDLLRLRGDHASAVTAYERALAMAPDAREALEGEAESLRVLGGDERLGRAMAIHRRLLAGREAGVDAAQRDRGWWLSQLRQLQILQAAGRFDEKALMRLNRLRAIDASLGGEAFAPAFERLAAPASTSP